MRKPLKENARPGEPKAGCSGEHSISHTSPAEIQQNAARHRALIEAWEFATEEERRRFLADIRERDSILWRDTEREFVGASLSRFAARKGGPR